MHLSRCENIPPLRRGWWGEGEERSEGVSACKDSYGFTGLLGWGRGGGTPGCLAAGGVGVGMTARTLYCYMLGRLGFTGLAACANTHTSYICSPAN